MVRGRLRSAASAPPAAPNLATADWRSCRASLATRFDRSASIAISNSVQPRARAAAERRRAPRSTQFPRPRAFPRALENSNERPTAGAQVSARLSCLQLCPDTRKPPSAILPLAARHLLRDNFVIPFLLTPVVRGSPDPAPT